MARKQNSGIQTIHQISKVTILHTAVEKGHFRKKTKTEKVHIHLNKTRVRASNFASLSFPLSTSTDLPKLSLINTAFELLSPPFLCLHTQKKEQ